MILKIGIGATRNQTAMRISLLCHLLAPIMNNPLVTQSIQSLASNQWFKGSKDQ